MYYIFKNETRLKNTYFLKLRIQEYYISLARFLSRIQRKKSQRHIFFFKWFSCQKEKIV